MALLWCSVLGTTWAQTITANATTVTNTGSGGTGTLWTLTSGALPASLLNFGATISQTIEAGGFDFSALPAGAIINGIDVTITKSGVVRDNRVSLMKGGVILPTNLGTTATWPVFGGSTVYGSATNLWGTTWLASDIKSTGFRVAIRVQSVGFGLVANVSNVAVRISYLTLAPITLSRFDVEKTNENTVRISWKTELEDKVQTLFVERSVDGTNFEEIASLQPKGGRNMGALYEVTDRTPADGNNYYRLKELDTEGQFHYYQTKLVRMFTAGQRTAVYQNGSQLVIRTSGLRGEVTARVYDANGRQTGVQKAKVSNSSSGFTMPAPAREGIHYVTISDGTTSETIKIFIAR